MSNKLTLKQLKFADSFIKLGNVTQAAVEAGYSKKTAYLIGGENLKKPEVKSYIDKRMKEIADNKIMDATEALELLTSIARGESKETVVTSTPDGIYETEKEADLKTRISAIKEILKRYPENDALLQAHLRKLNAEADISEIKATKLTSGGDKVMNALDKMLNKVTEGVDKDES